MRIYCSRKRRQYRSNVGSGVGISIGKVAEIIQQQLGKSIPIVEDRRGFGRSEVMKLICERQSCRLDRMAASLQHLRGVGGTLSSSTPIRNFKPHVYSV